VLTDTFVSRRHAVLRPGDVLQFGSPRSMKLCFHIAEPDKPLPSLSASLLSTLGHISAGQRTPAQEMGQLNFLLDAARRLNAGSATRDILHALLELTIQLTGVERGFALLYEQAAKHVSARDHRVSDLHVAIGLNSAGEILPADSAL
jgi:hypothetical protein